MKRVPLVGGPPPTHDQWASVSLLKDARRRTSRELGQELTIAAGSHARTQESGAFNKTTTSVGLSVRRAYALLLAFTWGLYLPLVGYPRIGLLVALATLPAGMKIAWKLVVFRWLAFTYISVAIAASFHAIIETPESSVQVKGVLISFATLAMVVPSAVWLSSALGVRAFLTAVAIGEVLATLLLGHNVAQNLAQVGQNPFLLWKYSFAITVSAALLAWVWHSRLLTVLTCAGLIVIGFMSDAKHLITLTVLTLILYLGSSRSRSAQGLRRGGYWFLGIVAVTAVIVTTYLNRIFDVFRGAQGDTLTLPGLGERAYIFIAADVLSNSPVGIGWFFRLDAETQQDVDSRLDSLGYQFNSQFIQSYFLDGFLIPHNLLTFFVALGGFLGLALTVLIFVILVRTLLLVFRWVDAQYICISFLALAGGYHVMASTDSAMFQVGLAVGLGIWLMARKPTEAGEQSEPLFAARDS